MGEVWKAEHLSLQSHVAVKFLVADTLGTRERRRMLARFRREARAAAKIKSPHVIHHFDFDATEDGIPYIVMELLEGRTLRERLEAARWLDPTEVGTIVQQVAKALGAAHAAGVVHRDIKPENIFVSDDEDLHVKVLDFGVVKVAGLRQSLTPTGSLVGTVNFMSPEIINGSSTGVPADDLWSLAVVAYEALTGEMPFDGPSFAKVCGSILMGSYLPPRQLRPTLQADVDAWFERAFHPERDRRFASAQELAQSFLTLREPPGGSPTATTWVAVDVAPALEALSTMVVHGKR
jgi:serine/threonine-protein kinase